MATTSFKDDASGPNVEHIDNEKNYMEAQTNPSNDAHADISNSVDGHGTPQHNAVFIADPEDLPPGYFKNPMFIGSYLATAMNLMAGCGGFALVAPVISQIDAVLGPDPAIVWVSLVYTLGLALGLTLVGRLSDIFGRRWFVVGGVVLGLLGAIVCATAKTVPVLVGGQTLIGLGASTGYSYAFLIGELVPMRHRFWVCSSLFVFSYPTAGFGAAISTAFLLYTDAGFRWTYYLLIILNTVTLLLVLLCYFPPSFHMKQGSQSKMKLIREFDYIGTFLYMAGLVLFIIGLSWGGSSYPWKSAPVISTIIIGFFLLVALFIYESKVTLAEPLIPMQLFQDRGWNASAAILSVGATVYYAMAIIWPQMAVTVYGNGNAMYAGWISCLVGVAITSGELCGGMGQKLFQYTGWQCMVCMTIGTATLGAMAAATPDTPSMAFALVFISVFAIGYNEAIASPLCTVLVGSQADVGAGGGTAGSIRSAVSSVGLTVYVAVLTNRVPITIADNVPAAVVGAGLPASSVADYFAAVALGSPSAIESVRGITPAIIAAGSRAYQVAYTQAYSSVFLTSIAFGIISIILCFWVPNVTLDDEVAATLHGMRDEKIIGHEKLEHKIANQVAV